MVVRILLCALMATSLSTPGEEDAERRPGHSHEGEAFNEGPRQSARLLGGTGEIDFPITTDWKQGQAFFNQGVGQLHGFWFYEAERSFREIAAHDPECAMAYWGMAMANWENEKRAREFIEKAVALKDGTTPRERLYLEAQADYLDGEPTDAKKRQEKLVTDLENIIHEFPEDLEARAFLACRVWQLSRKGRPISSREAVNALLDPVFAKKPLHPAHHFRIHLWDKKKASRAIESAAKLGHTAPTIAHMWHMPGHTYSDLKRYQDSAWHQEASARVDHKWMNQTRVLPDQIHNYAHNNEWLTRNWINVGRVDDALAMAKSLIANPRHPKLNPADKRGHSAGYGRARLLDVLVKFELWEEALRLADSPYLWEEDLPLDQQRDRLQLLGTAHFELGDRTALDAVLSESGSLLSSAEAKLEAAETEARSKAEAPSEEPAEGKKKPKEKSKKDIEKAVKDASKKPRQLVDSIKKTLSGIRAYLAILEGNREEAEKLFKDLPRAPYALARLRLRLEDTEAALKQSAEAVTKAPSEVLPLAARIEVLHAAGQADEARKAFAELSAISSAVDRDARPFKRLEPIAKDLGLEKDWLQPVPQPTDVGERPALASLGPLSWQPPLAPGFSLPDGEETMHSLESWKGKPVILIFYLGYGCLHCVDQLRAFAEHEEDFRKAGLPVLAISTDTAAKVLQSQTAFLEAGTPFPFPLLADPAHEVFQSYNAYDDFEDEPLHGTFILDPTGHVLWQDISAEPFEDPKFVLREARRLLHLHGEGH